MISLPVDSIIPETLAALAAGQNLIITAPPGSGKSTRVPPALLGADWLGEQKVLMLEPRRVAALNLALWIADGLGEPVGATVGYSIRFDSRTSPATRLEIVTEGLLVRRLQQDPFLEGVGAVVFDEFHERAIHADTALAFCLELQQTVRPELRIIIMSATIDAARLAAVVPNAVIISSDGSLYPVQTSYCGDFNNDPVKAAVAAVCKALKEEQGDILLFLPGSGEINRAAAMLREAIPGGDTLVLPLYGAIPLAEQQRAILPAERRKVVLATNIAETSLTIQGVTIVIDAGLVRRARFDRGRGLEKLVTERVSQAAAEQRAGRAGRLAPGICLRLWSREQQLPLLPFDPPEITVTDLCELALNLALWGVTRPDTLCWLDPPPAAALAEGYATLALLGAVAADRRITDRGRRLAALPLHPRLANLLLTAIDRGCGAFGADLAAILSERDFVRRSAIAPADLHERLEILQRFRQKAAGGDSDQTVDRSVLRGVERVAAQLCRLSACQVGKYQLSGETLALLAAAAFPDRVAAEREAGSRRYLLVNGTGACLPPSVPRPDSRFIVISAMDGGITADARILSAAPVDLAMLRELFSPSFNPVRTPVWDSSSRRVKVREDELFGAITVRSLAVKATREDVLQALGSCPAETLIPDGLLLQSETGLALQARALFLRRIFGEEWPDLSTAQLLATCSDWLSAAVLATDKPERFSGVDLVDLISSSLGWQRLRLLEQHAPESLQLPTGFRARIDYAGETPVVAVKLQELFGTTATPTVAAGRVRLLIHLLSPAGRPIQVTSDLAGFWKNGYLEVKKELKGRYPKHPWPDDPLTATPTRFTKKRSGQA